MSTINLDPDRLSRLEGWGMSTSSVAHVFHPTTLEELRTTILTLSHSGISIGCRGGGMSYGDAALNAEGAVVDLSRMNSILEFDEDSGHIWMEPGVTIRDMWQHALSKGWWPPVVPGTMHVTVGGALSMNIHGKNNLQAGTIGEHVTAFDIMTSNGDVISCSRTERPDLFHAAIGGMGMLGPITRVGLQMKRVTTGFLDVEAATAHSLNDVFAYFREHENSSDYIVGWLDAFAKGKRLGRGVIHRANHVPSETLEPSDSTGLDPAHQHLPSTVLGVIPKSMTWRLLRYFTNNPGMRLINAAKYMSAALRSPHQFRQGLVPFSFLLDYVPNWKKAYGKGGLIQYQCFVPSRKAETVFRSLLAIGIERHLQSYLPVMKRHRTDSFLFSHGVNGYSLALDFRVTRSNREPLLAMAREMNRLVLDSGGRFYFAKDSILSEDETRSFLGGETVRQFVRLKSECDPDSLFQTDLARRVLGRAFSIDRR